MATNGIKKIFVSSLTEWTSTQKDTLGDIRFEGNKVYKYVQLKNTTATVAGVAGDPVGYGSAGGYNSNLVVIDLSDADASNPIFAGCLAAAVAGVAGTTYYGWVQVTGAVAVPTAVGSGVIGAGCRLSTTDKTLSVELSGDVGGRIGILATTAGANNTVILRGMF